MAEGILRARAQDAHLAIEVSSAGIFEGGSPATDDAVAVCAELGVDIGQHVSRRLDRSMVDAADLVIAMTRDHLREAVVLSPTAFARTFTLRELVRRINEMPNASIEDLHAGRELAGYVRAEPDDDIVDPVGKPRAEYEKTAAQLDALLARLVAWLVAKGAERETQAAS